MVKKKSIWFKGYKGFIKLFKKKSKFVYLGEEIDKGALVLCNHVNTSAPLSFELYLDKPTRMWGAHEMNNGLISTYKYQTRVFYHEKRGWNIHLARLYCLLASPLTTFFYKGLNLINTYRDVRFKNTLKESLSAIEDGYNVVLFPEDSSNGYLDTLEGFHLGFVIFLEYAYKKGKDLPIYVTYYNKYNKVHIVDKPVYYSELIKNGESREEIAKKLCDRCNQIGVLSNDLSKIDNQDQKKTKIA